MYFYLSSWGSLYLLGLEEEKAQKYGLTAIILYHWIGHNFYYTSCFLLKYFQLAVCSHHKLFCPFSTWIWNGVWNMISWILQYYYLFIFAAFWVKEHILSKCFQRTWRNSYIFNLQKAGICFIHMILMGFKWNIRPLIQKRNKLV